MSCYSFQRDLFLDLERLTLKSCCKWSVKVLSNRSQLPDMHFLWASGEYSRHKLVRQAGRSWEAGFAQHAPSPPPLFPLPCFCPETHRCRGVGLQGQCWRSLQGQVYIHVNLLSGKIHKRAALTNELLADLQLNISVWQLLATAGMWSDVTGE